MSDSSKDRAALLFDDPEPTDDDGASVMAPRSDPTEKPTSTGGDSDGVEEVAEEDLRGLSPEKTHYLAQKLLSHWPMFSLQKSKASTTIWIP